VTTLYRVFPWLATAAAGEPGHPAFVPRLGAGRIDNPDSYLTLYLSDGPGGACAEAFFFKSAWGSSIFRGLPGLPGSVQAITTFELDPEVMICDLDDASRLLELRLRPSQIVTRDRKVTQAWALRIFREGRWGGIRWWSYYDPRWGSHGIWRTEALSVIGVEPLTLDHPAIAEAADVLNRRVG
jgi:hypothetical protein